MVGTTSCRDVLETMGIVESFNTVIHVPCLSSTDQLRAVLQVSLDDTFLQWLETSGFGAVFVIWRSQGLSPTPCHKLDLI